MFYALSKNENTLKDKINLFVALAPVLRVGNIPLENLKHMAESREQIIGMLQYYEMYEINNDELLSMAKQL